MRIATICSAALLPLGCNCEAAGADNPGLYPEQELRRWAEIYPKNVKWNFEHTILGALSSAEKAKLSQTKLLFPLWARDDIKDNPLAFYTLTKENTIVLPITSLKFLDDLCVAFAYITVNNGDPEVLHDYLLMIKYRQPKDFPGNSFPPPLRALGIPENADADPKVKSYWEPLLKSITFWILAHEVGHLVTAKIKGDSVAQISQVMESAADRFAIETMASKTIRVPPMGVGVLLTWFSWWSPNPADFNTSEEFHSYMDEHATHPLTASRILSLADGLEEYAAEFVDSNRDKEQLRQAVLSIAKQIRESAKNLSEPLVFELARARGIAADPRFMAMQVKYRAAPVDVKQQFHGTYVGAFSRTVQNGAKEYLRVRLNLKRDANTNTVTGDFDFGAGTGTLSGIISGNHLTLTSQWSGNSGEGTLDLNERGSLSGKWRLSRLQSLDEQWYINREASN